MPLPPLVEAMARQLASGSPQRRPPAQHILIRDMSDDGKVLNIADADIAHPPPGSLPELGHQSEWEVQMRLGREVEQDRFPRLDRAILDELNEQGQVEPARRQGTILSRLGQPISVRAPEEA